MLADHLGLTQADLAKRAGLPRASVQLLLRGKQCVGDWDASLKTILGDLRREAGIAPKIGRPPVEEPRTEQLSGRVSAKLKSWVDSKGGFEFVRSALSNMMSKELSK